MKETGELQEIPKEPQFAQTVLSPSGSSCSDQPRQTGSLKRKRPKIGSQSSADLQEQEAMKRCLEVLNSSKEEKDEYSIFGENVANELRLLNDVEDVQFTLKNSILKNIMDANLAAYELRKRRKMSSAVSTPLPSPSCSDHSSFLSQDYSSADTVPPTSSEAFYGDVTSGNTYTVLSSQYSLQ